MLIPSVTVESTLSVADALVRIGETAGPAAVPDDGYVIVRRRSAGQTYWYIFRAGFLRRAASRTGADATLESALGLSEGSVCDTFQIDDLTPAEEDDAWGVLLDGSVPMGVLIPEPRRGAVRSFDPAPAVDAPAAPSTTPVPATPLPAADAALPSAEAPLPLADPPAADLPAAAAPAPSATAPPPVTEFSAHPRLEAPSQVAAGTQFELVVGLATTPQPDLVADVSVVVPTAAAEFDLVVHVVADRFEVERVREVLHVVRADPEANTVVFRLTAPAIEDALWPTVLFVEYGFGGTICGRAGRAIVVTREPASTAAPADAPLVVMTPIRAAGAGQAPDLTASITESEDGRRLLWTFDSPHPVELPSTAVETPFQSHSAESFALHQVRLANQAAGDRAVENRMLGIARDIADELPPDFWRVLLAVWRIAAANGDVPSVLFVSSEAFIPWELASTEARYLGDDGPADPKAPPFLGAQVRLGRWMKSRPRGAGATEYPPLPPPTAVEVRNLALVIGDYLAQSGQRPLPKAAEEGEILAGLYEAVRLTATLDEIDPLFDGELVVNGSPLSPDAVHFACHGQVDPTPGFNGIILNEGRKRLDELYVRGNRMRQPFVFLNACQLGTSSELLAGYGGMAAVFLKEGCRGFVAPLWSVDDELARDTAVEFYELALQQGVSVAEVMRRLRAQFDMSADAPAPTHLAYTYYGHPDLVLSRPG